MNGIRGIRANKLTAIRFADEKNFIKAVKIVVAHDIPVYPAGYFTLIVRKSDKKLFKSLKFAIEKVADK